jgi:hypothetical protein
MEFPNVDWLDHSTESDPTNRFLVRVGKAALTGLGVGWLSGMLLYAGLLCFHGMSFSVPTDHEGNIMGLQLLPHVILTGAIWAVPGAIIGWVVGLVGTWRVAYGALIGMAGGALLTLLTSPLDGWLFLTVPFNSIFGALIGLLLGAIPVRKLKSTREPAADSPKWREAAIPSTWGDAMSMIKGFLIIVACGLVFGVCCGACGYALGRFVPGYYRSVFFARNREFDPEAVGLGLGVSQGLFAGLLIGCVVVLAVAWYRSRREVIERELSLVRRESARPASGAADR